MHDEGLFDAIRESPRDQTLRRIHADWFEEHGEADRAEFVRLQLSVAPLFEDLSLYAQGFDPHQREVRLPLWRRHLERFGPTHPSQADLLREAELLQRNRRRWNGAIHRWLGKTALAGWVGSRRCGLRGWAYRSGFVEVLVCTPEAWRDHAPILRRIGPIRCLRLCASEHRLNDLWNELNLSGLDVVSFEGHNFRASQVQALLTAPCARALPVLDLRGCHFPYDAAVDAWLKRPAIRVPQLLYTMPNPIGAGYYPPPPLPTAPQTPWLKAWLAG